MTNKFTNEVPRREFIKTAVSGAVASSALVAGFPAIVPASVIGKKSPCNQINVGAIGTGRISRIHDLPNIWKYDHARIMAVCDLDSHRVEDAKILINEYYSRKTGKAYDGVTGYGDHRELLANNLRDRTGRDPPVQERRSAWQLA